MSESPPAGPRRWSEARILAWLLVLLVCGALFGPTQLSAAYSNRDRWSDFYQEWFSAHNVWQGGPAYAPLRELARRYTDLSPEFVETMLLWNAHPPVSVLLALPLGGLAFQDAQNVWNLVNYPLFVLSIVLVIRGLKIPFQAASLLPTFALALACYPLFTQVQHGQLNIVLLTAVTVGWFLDRAGYRTGAGVAIGVAAAVKLVPAFLLLYFLGTRRWRSLAAGVATFAALNGLAVAVLGVADVRVYVETVVPSVTSYVSSRFNQSPAGFWLRLLDPHPDSRVDSFVVAPAAAQVLSVVTRAVVVGLVVWRARRAQTVFDHDRAFAAAVVGMLLVSPITWDHYSLILAMPVALAWWHVQGLAWRVVFWVVLVRTWLPNHFVPILVLGKDVGTTKYLFGFDRVATGENLYLASLPFYAIVAFFTLVFALRERTPATVAVSGGGP